MAAIDQDGTEHRARSRHSARCTALNAKGNPCGAWALTGQDVCLRHSMSDEEWQEMAYRGGRGRAAQRREKARLRDTSRNRHEVPGPTLARAIEVVNDLLDATLAGTPEPNIESRAWGVLCVAMLFRAKSRAELLELLTAIKPAVAKDRDLPRLMNLQAAAEGLVQAYEQGRIKAEELPPGVLGLVRGVPLTAQD